MHEQPSITHESSVDPWADMQASQDAELFSTRREAEETQIAQDRAAEDERIRQQREQADAQREADRRNAESQRVEGHRQALEIRRNSDEVRSMNDGAAERLQTRYGALLAQGGKSREARNAEARAFKKDTDDLISGDNLEPVQAELILTLRDERNKADQGRHKAIFARNAQKMGADAKVSDIEARTQADIEKFHENNGEYEGLDKYILRERGIYTREEYDEFRNTDEFTRLVAKYRDQQREKRARDEVARAKDEVREAYEQKKERRDAASVASADEAPVEPADSDAGEGAGDTEEGDELDVPDFLRGGQDQPRIDTPAAPPEPPRRPYGIPQPPHAPTGSPYGQPTQPSQHPRLSDPVPPMQYPYRGYPAGSPAPRPAPVEPGGVSTPNLPPIDRGTYTDADTSGSRMGDWLEGTPHNGPVGPDGPQGARSWHERPSLLRGIGRGVGRLFGRRGQAAVAQQVQRPEGMPQPPQPQQAPQPRSQWTPPAPGSRPMPGPGMPPQPRPRVERPAPQARAWEGPSRRPSDRFDDWPE